ncbi:MAG: LuxR C-terminal-related transcriptional regulator, partial [Cyanobacteria bacterium J06648_11]
LRLWGVYGAKRREPLMPPSIAQRASSVRLCNREIAEQLNVSQRTIESHVSNMLGKTGLHNRTELARWAMEGGISGSRRFAP